MSIPSLLPHPLAELFPLMTGADFDALIEDIRANGQHQAIVLFEGKILDGRNRYRACAELGIEPRVEEYHETCSPQSYVASANLHRRHLNEQQRAMIATRMAKWQDTDMLKRGSAAATAAAGISQTEAAKLLNVSRTAVQGARIILEQGTPEEIAAADGGHLGIRTTADAIRQGITASERAKNRLIPSHKKGDSPKAYEKQRFNADIWGQLRDALTNINGLPAPADVAKIAKQMDRSNLVDRTLSNAMTWIKDFEDVWTEAH